MTPPLVVLYEDQLAPETKPKQYGLHVLALACVSDNRRVGRWELPASFAHACKGRDKLLKELELRRGEPRLIAAIDHDQVRLALGLPADACKTAVLASLRVRHTGAIFVLVVENTEDVVAAARRALGRAPVQDKPTPRRRDADLHALANADPEVRRLFLAECPSFARLVLALDVLLTPSLPAAL